MCATVTAVPPGDKISEPMRYVDAVPVGTIVVPPTVMACKEAFLSLEVGSDIVEMDEPITKTVAGPAVFRAIV